MAVTRRIICSLLFAFMLAASTEVSAQQLEWRVRLGYSIGGTAPVGLPATIRSLDNYSLQANFLLGIDAWTQIGGAWGAEAGVYVRNTGMETDTRVKNYHMAMVSGGERLEGMFTGQVVTLCDQTSLTIPIQVTFDLNSRWRLRLGPQLSYVLWQKFEGEAYGGYLRVGDPTGNKVEIGSDSATRGSYDFADDLRRWQIAIDLGADWFLTDRWGAYAELSWGLGGVFKSSFETIEQTLYPIYGVIGCLYKL